MQTLFFRERDAKPQKKPAWDQRFYALKSRRYKTEKSEKDLPGSLRKFYKSYVADKIIKR